MTVVTAQELTVVFVHSFEVFPTRVIKPPIGFSLSSEHELDVSSVAYYSGFLLVRSVDKKIQLSGELGKGSFNNLARVTHAGVLDVAGRVAPVVLTGPRGSVAGEFSMLFYDSESDVTKARSLFATGSVIEIRLCPEPLLEKSWIAVLEVAEARLPYADWARKFQVSFIQTNAPL